MLQSKAGYIDARPLPPDRQNSLATHGRTIHWVIHVAGCQGRLPVDVRNCPNTGPKSSDSQSVEKGPRADIGCSYSITSGARRLARVRLSRDSFHWP